MMDVGQKHSSCSLNTPDKASTAKQRWDILAKSIKQHSKMNISCDPDPSVSVRRFESFDLLLFQKKDADDIGFWYEISSRNIKARAQIRLLYSKTDPKTLIGFNNTGNVCVWPAEEIMTYFCQKKQDDFRGKRVCEIGGGMTSLAGLMLAVGVKAEKIYLTDGNQESATNICAILEKNRSMFATEDVTAGQLIWGKRNVSRQSNEDIQYDYVICADCLFFEECHQDLIETLNILLKDKGIALLFAPRRGSTLSSFVGLAKQVFDVHVRENYDDHVWERHQVYQSSLPLYDENIHYPFLITMKKKNKERQQCNLGRTGSVLEPGFNFPSDHEASKA